MKLIRSFEDDVNEFVVFAIKTISTIAVIIPIIKEDRA
jgi:hypothetical protein